MGYDYGKIWVAGAYGRVGLAIVERLDTRKVDLLETDIDGVDVTDAQAVSLFAGRNRPNTIINCTGMTDSETCEKNIEEAYKVNALGARNLAAAARKLDARIIQLSTDDIFGDTTYRVFNEFDTPNPATIYGKSKLAGENFVKELAPKHLIIRSSWVYAQKGENFVNSILSASKSGKSIEAADDQFACPTSARELSRVILRLIKNEEEGVYHAVCGGYCSRYELAEEILRLTGRADVELIPRKLKELNPGMPYSAYTILDNMMLRMCGIEQPVSWQEALKEYVQQS